MPKVKLTTQFVLNPPLPTARKIDYYDSSITGFILEVRSSGLATFYLRYRDLYGHQRQVKIGDAKSISLDQAKQKAKVLRSEVVLNGQPDLSSKEKKQIPRLVDFVNDHYLGHIATYRRNYASDLSKIRNHICQSLDTCIWIKFLLLLLWSCIKNLNLRAMLLQLQIWL